MNADAPIYLDSSALVKLIVVEAESNALAGHLRQRPIWVSCALARVEVIRAVRAHGQPAIERARQLLQRISLQSLYLKRLAASQHRWEHAWDERYQRRWQCPR